MPRFEASPTAFLSESPVAFVSVLLVQEARPGPPFAMAADKLASRVLGVDIDAQQRQKAGMASYYAAGLAWAPIYQLLRRRTRMGPVAAGLVTGASQSLILDETITPAIGASAPNRAYPLSTHLRGLAAHLAFGRAIAATTELAWKMIGSRGTCRWSRPDQPRR